MKSYTDILKEKGLRVTSQRVSILKILDKKNSHLTAEEIMEALKTQDVVISLASIYNTLDLFEKNSLINKVSHDSDGAKYDGNTEFHLHLKDEEKNIVEDYSNEEFMELVKNFMNKNDIKGFDIRDINITINGKFIS